MADYEPPYDNMVTSLLNIGYSILAKVGLGVDAQAPDLGQVFALVVMLALVAVAATKLVSIKKKVV